MNGLSGDPRRFRLLATYLARRSLEVCAALPGESARTDGRVVYVSCGAAPDVQRREVVVQAALLGAGSLDHKFVKGLWGRPKPARRYLALEGRRVLADIAGWVPIVAAFGPAGEPKTASAAESLEVACGRRPVADPPDWFGVIRPSRLLGASARARCGADRQGPSSRP